MQTYGVLFDSEGDMVMTQGSPQYHSTPRSSFGHRLMKGYLESSFLHSSKSSCYTVNNTISGNETTGTLDRLVQDNHMKEMEHRNNRMNEELESMRQELAAMTESNESLQAEVNKLSKKLSK